MVWIKAVQRLPLIHGVSRSLAAYADDQKVHFIAHVSQREALRRDISQVLEVSAGWAAVTDQAYSPAKSQLWALRSDAPGALGDFFLDGSQIPWVGHINLLGLDLVSNKACGDGIKQNARAKEVANSVWRLKHLPLPLKQRAAVCGMKYMSKSAHGCGVFRPSRKDIQWHDKAMIDQLWHGAPNRAAEALAILHVKGQQCLLKWGIPLQAIRHHMRQLRRYPRYRQRWELIWELHREGTLRVTGVGQVWIAATEQLRWRWTAPFQLITDTGESLSLLDDEPGHILHLARESLRKQEQKTLEARRPTFSALGLPWDRKGVWAFEDGIRDPYLLGIWRGIAVGGILWGKARQAMGTVQDPHCETCQGHSDNLPGLLWECPTMQIYRDKLGISKAWADAQAPCLVHHGIPVEGTISEESPSGEPHRLTDRIRALQLFLLVAVTLRALRQLNPACLHGGIPLELREELNVVALFHKLPPLFDEA
jgi:hypothetical protein